MTVRQFLYCSVLAYMIHGIPLYAKPILTITNQEQLQEQVGQHELVVVEFLMAGCTHCQRFERAKTFAKLADQFPTAQFVKIFFKNTQLIKQYNIRTFPSFIIFINGVLSSIRHAGFSSEQNLKNKINQVMQSIN